jgi:hypothetical protein
MFIGIVGQKARNERFFKIVECSVPSKSKIQTTFEIPNLIQKVTKKTLDTNSYLGIGDLTALAIEVRVELSSFNTARIFLQGNKDFALCLKR